MSDMQVEKGRGRPVDHPPFRNLVVVGERVAQVRRVHVRGPARVRCAQLLDHRRRLRFGEQRVRPSLWGEVPPGERQLVSVPSGFMTWFARTASSQAWPPPYDSPVTPIPGIATDASASNPPKYCVS